VAVRDHALRRQGLRYRISIARCRTESLKVVPTELYSARQERAASANSS